MSGQPLAQRNAFPARDERHAPYCEFGACYLQECANYGCGRPAETFGRPRFMVETMINRGDYKRPGMWLAFCSDGCRLVFTASWPRRAPVRLI